MAANKGEWGEPYVALRLLGDGKMYLADDNNMKNPNEWMKILELIRHEAKDRIVTYKYDDKETYILIDVNGRMLKSWDISAMLFCSTSSSSKFMTNSGLKYSFRNRVSKWRMHSLVLPDVPVCPITCPAFTIWLGFTHTLSRWAYTVSRPL